jgi:hypothetical protein
VAAVRPTIAQTTGLPTTDFITNWSSNFKTSHPLTAVNARSVEVPVDVP